MRALLLALRSSGLWVVMAVLSVLAALVILRSPSYRVGNWLAAGAHGAELAFYLSPVAAAAAAWVASVRERAGLDEQLSAAAKSQRRIDGVGLVAVVCTAVVPYLVGNAVGFGLTARTFPPGVEWWLRYLVLGGATVVLSVALGWLFGRLFPPIYSAVVAAVLTLAWQMYTPTRSGIIVSSGEPWEGPTLRGLAVRCALATGLVVLLAFVAWKRDDPDRRGRYVAAGVVAVFAVGLFSVQRSHAIALREIPANPTCVGEAVTVCLWPEDERLIPMVESFERRLRDLPSVLVLPDTVYQYGLLQNVTEYQGETNVQPTGLDVSETNRWSYAVGMSEQIEKEIVEVCRPTHDDGWVALERVIKWTEFRLMRSTEPDYSVSGAPPVLLQAWNDAEVVASTYTQAGQLAWVNEQLTAALGPDCPLLQP